MVAAGYLFYIPRDTVRFSKLRRLSCKPWKLTELGKEFCLGCVIQQAWLKHRVINLHALCVDRNLLRSGVSILNIENWIVVGLF
jgi:hypothetical protein